jgi:hypothetical protein
MDPFTVFCENCGAANQPAVRVCLVCGQAMPIRTPVAPVEKPVMTTLHPQGSRCPRCGKSDAVEQVSSLVEVASTGRFAGPASMSMSLADVRQKLALPSAPVYQSPWNFPTVFAFVVTICVVFVCVIGLVSWVQPLVQAPTDPGILWQFVGLTIFMLLWLGLAVFIVRSRSWMARERRAKVAAWQSVRNRWAQTYYCTRDDVVFLPGEQGTDKPASEMLWFLQRPSS